MGSLLLIMWYNQHCGNKLPEVGGAGVLVIDPGVCDILDCKCDT